MIFLDADAVARFTPWTMLADAIERAVADNQCESPSRLSYEVKDAVRGTGRLLVMPAWRNGSAIGIKTVMVWPGGHGDDAKPSHVASFVLLDAQTGAVIAILDGNQLTARRTAAVSVVAARKLLRRDAERLLVVGTGPVAFHLAEAHSASRRFSTIEIHGRRPAAAEAMVAQLAAKGIDCKVSLDLAASVRAADMIAAATAATTPIIDGAWLRDDAHLALIGGFTPTMREANDTAIRRASAIWVDDHSATATAGDLVQPIADGVLTTTQIDGDLRALLDQTERETASSSGITIFKSVGFATLDLAAAEAAVAAFTREGAQARQVQRDMSFRPTASADAYQVHAFTKRLHGGNPAGVCVLESWPGDETLRAIAVDFGSSVTAFMVDRADGQIPLRWFTRGGREVQSFCGHATFAAAHVMLLERARARNTIVFETVSGRYHATARDSAIEMAGSAWPSIEMNVDGDILAAIGATPINMYRGKRDLLMLFGAASEISALQPDFARLRAIGDTAVVATAPDAGGGFVYRFFCPGFSIGEDEDPATGSALNMLAPFWAARMGQEVLEARQLSTRGGIFACSVNGERVTIRSSCRTFLAGQMQIDMT